MQIPRQGDKVHIRRCPMLENFKWESATNHPRCGKKNARSRVVHHWTLKFVNCKIRRKKKQWDRRKGKSHNITNFDSISLLVQMGLYIRLYHVKTDGFWILQKYSCQIGTQAPPKFSKYLIWFTMRIKQRERCWHTLFEIKRIPSCICLFDLLAGPVNKHLIIHVCLNGQTWMRKHQNSSV